MSGRFDRLLRELAVTEVSDRACNQYAASGPNAQWNRIRRRNLRLYLGELEALRPRILLIGEAPSYRGGRLTGIPFVSETLLLGGVRLATGRHVLGAERGYRKATPGPALSTEASATMVWQTIRDVEPLPLLWNAFPFHPFHAGNADTNRLPTAAELLIGQRFIRMLLRLFAIEQVVAVGNSAASSLQRLEIPHEKVRHPSQGGKVKFVAGVARLSQFPLAEDSMPEKKSQIQEIKEGRAMHERTFTGRVQPYGPKAALPTKNAVRLSTVPSSSEEKFNGGKE